MEQILLFARSLQQIKCLERETEPKGSNKNEHSDKAGIKTTPLLQIA